MSLKPVIIDTDHVAMDVEYSGVYTTGETVIDHMGLWGREPNGHFAHSVRGNKLVEQWVYDMKNYNNIQFKQA